MGERCGCRSSGTLAVPGVWEFTDADYPMLAESPRDRVEQRLIVHGLAEIRGRAGSLRHVARFRCVVRGDENNRQVASRASEQGGQFEAARSGHPHVRDHARIFVGQIGVHEFLHRLEGPRLHLRRTHDACVSGANRRLVVHDIDLNRRIWHRLVMLEYSQRWRVAAIGPKSYTRASWRSLLALATENNASYAIGCFTRAGNENENLAPPAS